MSRSLTTILATLWLLLLGLLSHGAFAAEVQFRSECHVDGGLVLLADVAEIFDANPEEVKRLSRIDLFPAPPMHEKRVVRVREIQDLLHLRGENSSLHHFSGASQVTVLGVAETTVRTAKTVSLEPIQQINSRVRTAIQEYLTQSTGEKKEWIVAFELTPEQAQSLAPAGLNLLVEGGQSPWTGLQALSISGRTQPGVTRVPLGVQVTLPPTVVVALQALPRGATIKASDLKLQVGKAGEGKVRIYTTIDEVVGKETTQNIVEGQILDDHVLRRPLLVQRTDLVTVYARTSGLRVRTTVRALEAGGEGDLVKVETLTDRKTYFARVCGPQELEVFAHAPTVAGEAPPERNHARVQPSSYVRRGPSPPLPAESTLHTTK